MKKKISITVGLVIISFAVIVLGVNSSDLENADNDVSNETNSSLTTNPEHVEEEFDVRMPTKVSRPGCELTDECYIPSKISVGTGYLVTWINDDSAFHSVTSGPYGDPTGLFDSGHMDPGDVFAYQFNEAGEFQYHCTLHPWMEGTVLVG